MGYEQSIRMDDRYHKVVHLVDLLHALLQPLPLLQQLLRQLLHGEAYVGCNVDHDVVVRRDVLQPLQHALQHGVHHDVVACVGHDASYVDRGVVVACLGRDASCLGRGASYLDHDGVVDNHLHVDCEDHNVVVAYLDRGASYLDRGASYLDRDAPCLDHDDTQEVHDQLLRVKQPLNALHDVLVLQIKHV